MQYQTLKLWVPFVDLIIPTSGSNGKHISIVFFGENTDLLSSINFIKIRKNTVRYIYVPTTKYPVVTNIDSKLRKEITNHQFIPIKGIGGDFSPVINNNFYYDTSLLDKFMSKRWKNITQYSSSIGRNYINYLLSGSYGIPSDTHERVLLYVVNLNNPLPQNVFKFKFYPIYEKLVQWGRNVGHDIEDHEDNKKIKNDKNVLDFPYDKIIVVKYNESSSTMMTIFDKKLKNNNINRIRQYMVSLGKLHNNIDTNIEKHIEEVSEKVAEVVVDKMIPNHKREEILNTDTDIHDNEVVQNEPVVVKKVKDLNTKIFNTVRNYISNKPDKVETVSKIYDDKEYLNLAKNAVIFHNVADINKSEKLGKKNHTEKESINIIEKSKDVILPKEKLYPLTTHPIIKMIKPEQLLNYQSPKHIMDKRKYDFTVHLQENVLNSFKTLENMDIPIKIMDIKKDTIHSDAGEIKKSIRDRYTINVKNHKGKTYDVHIDIPHMTENGTFFVNGQEKVLLNQIIRYPIYFPYLDKGVFHSSYATFSIENKRILNSLYYIIYMGGYKIPLAMLLGYKIGLLEMFNLFDVQYNYTKVKEKNSNYTRTIKLGNDLYINFIFDPSKVYTQSIVESFNKSLNKYFKDNEVTIEKLESKNLWRSVLEEECGNRNCTYIVSLIWDLVVTPVEEKILKYRNDPYTTKDIIIYICKTLISGRVDDFNDIENLRIRTSELFISLIQKQLYSAYSEYKARVLGGDESPQLYINPTKVYSDIVLSQNVSTFENINPLEEISMMTRVTPIGIGGMPDDMAYPKEARNVHPSMFGNIDPLESSEGKNIGIVQHLTVGSNICNQNGLFIKRDNDNINPNEILSATTSLIPFVEHNDSIRILMAAGQIKQAIPLKSPEISAIQSGYESIFTNLLSSNFIKKSPVDGVVSLITTLEIIIIDKDKNKHVVDIKSVVLKSGQGVDGLGVFKPTVKAGERVKQNQVIAEGSNIKDGFICNGTNLLAVIMPWKGFNFEDGMVVSEDVMDKLESLHSDNEEIFLLPDEDVSYIAKIGDEMKKGDVLLSYSSTIYDVETIKHLRCEGGKVVNIEIYSNKQEEEIPHELLDEFKMFRERYLHYNKKYPIGKFKFMGKEFEGIYIKFTIERSSKLMKGDKINNRSFNKGVISLIEKPENMPQTPFGPAQIVLSPMSPINRMNPGQLLELHCGLISKQLYKLMISQNRNSFINSLSGVLNFIDKTDNKQYTKNLIMGLKSISDNEYKDVVEKIKENKFFPIIIPPFKSPSNQEVLNALDYLGLKAEYPVTLKEFGNMVTEPVAMGYLYVVKLEHIGEKKISSRSTGSYTSKYGSPAHGKYSKANKIGEYEVYSLSAWGVPHIIDEFLGPLSNDHATKNEMISDIIRTGKTEFRPGKTSSTKEVFSALMKGIHLEST